MNPISAWLGPNRVIILTNTDAFGAKHVTDVFTTLSLVKDDAPYQPDGPKWVRFTDNNGQPAENLISDWSIRTRFANGLDGVLLSPFRQYPNEAVEPVASAKVGDTVLVYSKAHGGSPVSATVQSLDENYTIRTSYQAISGDSGSLVTTPDGVFVGFVSAAYQNGSAISVPPLPSVPVVLPPPVVVPPPVLPVISPEAAAYARGVIDGKRQAADLIAASIS